MAPLIEKRQQAQFGHRTNFWALPGSAPNTVSWHYKTQDWVVKRPEDGEPAFRRTVRCKTCRKLLAYRIHSIEATLDRYDRWRAGAYGGLTLLVLGLIGLVFVLIVGGSAIRVGLVAAAIGAGAMSGWIFGLVAACENGVSGHFNGWPGATKHAVVLRDRSANVPELACPRCGHREEFSGDVEGPPEGRYQAAKARLDRHECRTP
ncbi:hypothetical protein [Actinomadura sp. DC4]|uniref:hypothetical protein n=1 Tax=Actinomadura sp. DC4 TaxID=3055069 RepID=UPI0025B0E027|nr:hypothetical protein [Actinomadura sp. DC4]MDN3354595.1 hypothetical protein [Actinomadura sp. DC4]